MIIGIGCDIVDISRIQKQEESFAKRILTKKEFACYKEFHSKRKIEYLAGRFAAKEAVCKAMDTQILLSAIEILNDKNGRPCCHIEGYKIQISISHEAAYAIAYVLIEREE